MDKKKQKDRKPLIDAERLAELLGLIEEFRHDNHLSTGEFEFLLKVVINILEELHSDNRKMATIAKEIRQDESKIQKYVR